MLSQETRDRVEDVCKERTPEASKVNEAVDSYTEMLDALGARELTETDDIESVLDTLCKDIEGTLTEGSGVVTNAIAIGMTRGLRKVASSVKQTKDLGKKQDRIAAALMHLGAMVLLSIAVSGDKKGLLSKGMGLVSIATSMKKVR